MKYGPNVKLIMVIFLYNFFGTKIFYQSYLLFSKVPMGQDKVCWARSMLKMWHKPREVKQIPIQNERCVKVKGEILKFKMAFPF